MMSSVNVYKVLAIYITNSLLLISVCVAIEYMLNYMLELWFRIAISSFRFDFCQTEVEHNPSENLGQVVFGERIVSSPYNFTFGNSNPCVHVCKKQYPAADDKKADSNKKLNFLKRGIMYNYQHHWCVCLFVSFSCCQHHSLTSLFNFKGS